jgi:hypothetical protein
MVCQQCGKENADGSRFCGACGSTLPDNGKQSPAGAGQQPQQPPQQPNPQQPQGPPPYQQHYQQPSQYQGQYPPQFQQGQPYQRPPYGTPPPYQQFTPDQRGYYPPPGMPYGGGAQVASHLALAIVSVFLFWPTAIAAIIFATRVDSRLHMGDYYGAVEASHKAKIWGWIGIGVGAAGWILLIVLWITLWAGVVATGLQNGVIY